MTTTQSVFGQLSDGREVQALTLTNSHGVCIRVIGYGASLRTVLLPDRAGRISDVVLGYRTCAPMAGRKQGWSEWIG